MIWLPNPRTLLGEHVEVRVGVTSAPLLAESRRVEPNMVSTGRLMFALYEETNGELSYRLVETPLWRLPTGVYTRELSERRRREREFLGKP